MNAELKAKWVAALRSGEFAQASGQLRKSLDEARFGYCCMGVACVVAGAEFIEGGSIATYKENKTRDDMAVSYMPPLLALDLGLSIDAQAKLASMNDSKNYTFAQLADYIEREIPADMPAPQSGSPHG